LPSFEFGKPCPAENHPVNTPPHFDLSCSKIRGGSFAAAACRASGPDHGKDVRPARPSALAVDLRSNLYTALLLTLLAIHPAVAQYDPPTGYYATAEGLTGPALKAALHDIIDDHTIIAADGGDSFQALRTLDEDPNNASRVVTIYSGTSESKFANGGRCSDLCAGTRHFCVPQRKNLYPTNSVKICVAGARFC
jgi:hypothetical protein